MKILAILVKGKTRLYSLISKFVCYMAAAQELEEEEVKLSISLASYYSWPANTSYHLLFLVCLLRY